MTDREKLIKLLEFEPCEHPMICSKDCKYSHLKVCFAERYADFLLENGVTFKDEQKTVVGKSLEYDGELGFCPTCNCMLHRYDNPKSCSMCGQILDWSEEE